MRNGTEKVQLQYESFLHHQTLSASINQGIVHYLEFVIQWSDQGGSPVLLAIQRSAVSAGLITLSIPLSVTEQLGSSIHTTSSLAADR